MSTTPTVSAAAIEVVATAICRSRTCEGASCCQWPAQMGRINCPVKRGAYDDAARDAIAAIPHLSGPSPVSAAGVPEGWKLVPVEPTDAQMKAAADTPGIRAVDNAIVIAIVHGGGLPRECEYPNEPLRQAYRAMLAASPTPPISGGYAGRDAI